MGSAGVGRSEVLHHARGWYCWAGRPSRRKRVVRLKSTGGEGVGESYSNQVYSVGASQKTKLQQSWCKRPQKD